MAFRDSLRVGEKLEPGEFMRSPNGLYVLTMQPDGKPVLRAFKGQKDIHHWWPNDDWPQREPDWKRGSHLAVLPAAHTVFNCNALVLRDRDGRVVWTSRKWPGFPRGHKPPHVSDNDFRIWMRGKSSPRGEKCHRSDEPVLYLQDDGNLVLYKSRRRRVADATFATGVIRDDEYAVPNVTVLSIENGVLSSHFDEYFENDTTVPHVLDDGKKQVLAQPGEKVGVDFRAGSLAIDESLTQFDLTMESGSIGGPQSADNRGKKHQGVSSDVERTAGGVIKISELGLRLTTLALSLVG